MKNKKTKLEKTEEKRVYMCLPARVTPLAISHGPHTPTHLQQMPSTALCEVGSRYTMWDEVKCSGLDHMGSLRSCPAQPCCLFRDLRTQNNAKTPGLWISLL